MEKCEERCPFCAPTVEEWGEDYHKVYPAYLGRYVGHPFCTHCGAFFVDDEWFKECKTCGGRVDELCGLFVPHNCKECQDKVVEADRKAGRVCGRCRQVYAHCCC